MQMTGGVVGGNVDECDSEGGGRRRQAVCVLPGFLIAVGGVVGVG